MKTVLPAAALGLLALLQPHPGFAAEPAPACGPLLTRANLVACTLSSSLALREAMAGQRAADGRLEAARPFLPANPALSGTLASRAGPVEQRVNWSVGLAQELEIGGQRGLRLDVLGGEQRASAQRLRSARTSVLAEAWVAWFCALATQERLKLAQTLEAASEDVATTVRAMAAGGLSSELEADVAEAAALRASQDRLRAAEEVAVAQAGLRRLLGGAQAPMASGELEPLGQAAGLESPGAERPEVLALRERQVALQGRVTLLQRGRVPNPSLSLFAQNDGFDERVLGVGLSVPIPVARPLLGEVAEAGALADQASVEVERVEREVQAELEVARARYEAAARVRALYAADRVARARTRLESISVHVKAARLPVRDALLAQQALTEQLRAGIDAREALCVASVQLTRAAGLSLEGEAR